MKETKTEETETEDDLDELWNADENCDHNIVNAPGGGVKCTKCSGWFCF